MLVQLSYIVHFCYLSNQCVLSKIQDSYNLSFDLSEISVFGCGTLSAVCPIPSEIQTDKETGFRVYTFFPM